MRKLKRNTKKPTMLMRCSIGSATVGSNLRGYVPHQKCLHLGHNDLIDDVDNTVVSNYIRCHDFGVIYHCAVI